MHRRALPVLLALAAGLAVAAPALAQNRFVFLDRTGGSAQPAQNRLFVADDGGAGTITNEATQVSVFWSSLNGAGTAAMLFPQALAYRPSDGMLAVGDNSARTLYYMSDLNRAGTAQDVGESRIVADGTNAGGIVLNVQGVAFDNAGNLYASCAFNSTAGSVAAIYKMTDTDAVPDGRFNSAGEIVTLVGSSYMGASSSSVPGNVCIDNSTSPPTGYWKNSANATNLGVHRFNTATGAANPFFTSANGSGIALAAALPMCVDAARPASVYFPQTVSSIRQVVRAQDTGGNGTANDAGEGAVVWATAEALTIIDIISLPDGRVVLTEGASVRRILILTPTGNTFNGYSGTPFTTGNGYSLFYVSSNNPTGTPPTPGTVRHIVAVARPCQANCDDSTQAPVLNVADFSCFLTKYAAGDYYANCDGSTQAPVLNVADFSCFLSAYAGGCP